MYITLSRVCGCVCLCVVTCLRMPHYPVIPYGVDTLETDQPGAENGSVVKEHVIQAWGVPSEWGYPEPT